MASIAPGRQTATPDPVDDARLAADLGRVLEDILEHTAHGLMRTLAQRDISPLQLRLLRQAYESLGAVTPSVLARRVRIDAAAVEHEVDELLARDLLARSDGGLRLTSTGRRVVLDVAQARREDLEAFVSGLDVPQRMRIDAAVHLLVDHLAVV
jgi:DNA-binding MarR family transcriptional regulator